MAQLLWGWLQESVATQGWVRASSPEMALQSHHRLRSKNLHPPVPSLPSAIGAHKSGRTTWTGRSQSGSHEDRRDSEAQTRVSAVGQAREWPITVI